MSLGVPSALVIVYIVALTSHAGRTWILAHRCDQTERLEPLERVLKGFRLGA
jgi:hypothetical protein